MYRAHTCKYIVNWGNYTKGPLNLKCPNWGSFDIPKLIYTVKQAGDNIKQTEWNTYFGMQKLLLKLYQNKKGCWYSVTVSPSAPPEYPLLSELTGQMLSLPDYPVPPPPAASLNQAKKDFLKKNRK